MLLSKQSPSGLKSEVSNNNNGKTEPANEIDLNELFRGEGPRFLQLELYKDFKPPIVLIQDKHYIENILATSAYSKSKSRRNFAAHLAKLVKQLAYLASKI